MQSQPAAISASERSNPESPTVVAAATRSRPSASLVANGAATDFSMSLTVIRPTQWLPLVDHQQFLDPPLMEDAPGLGLGGADRHGREIVAGHQLADLLLGIFGEADVAVGQDAGSLPDFSTIGMPLMRWALISSSAWASVWSGVMVIGLTTIPLSNRLTWRTAVACSSIPRLR